MARDDSATVFDSGTLEQLKELIDGDDSSFLDDLFQSYLTTAEEIIGILRNEPDNIVLHRAAHTLKGSSLNVGAVGVAGVCRQLEADLKKNDVSDMPVRIATIETQLQRVIEAYPSTVAQLLAKAS